MIKELLLIPLKLILMQVGSWRAVFHEADFSGAGLLIHF